MHPDERSRPERRPREQSTALAFAVSSVIAVVLAVLVRDESGAVIFCLGVLLGIIGFGRGLYEASKPDRYRGGVGVALVLSFLTGIGGVLLVVAFINMFGLL